MRTMIGFLALALSTTALAQVPASELDKPPADARHFEIRSTGGKHGDSWSWIAADGTRHGRESLNLRGQVWEVDYRGTSGPDGMPQTVTIRGVTPQGNAGETFLISKGSASWQSQIDGGSTPYAAPKFYSSVGGPIDTTAWFVERLLASPNKTLDLLPGGTARAEQLTTLDVGSGAAKQTITLWAITGVGTSPLPVWTDAKGKFFGLFFALAWVPEAYANEAERIETAQADALAAQAPAIAKALVKTPTTPVAFTNVRMFDAERARFLTDQTVVISKDKIIAVGPAAKVKVPANAERIDGRGKTLIPGMWDVHMHVGDDYTGPQELSLGVTSVRDPGNNDKLTMDRRTRIAAGQLLFPNVYASSLIDGKGPYTAQVANVATSQAEAIQRVDQAAANKFVGVKFYGTFNPDWLKASIARARAKELHVHGHIPAGIRPMDAINAGYDEITHINWIMMQAMPDSVIKVSNGIARFEGPGRYARTVDLNGPEITGIINAMAKKKIYSDPTMVAFESLYVPENGDLSPSYAPFVGTMPPTTERGFRSGGFAVPKDLTRDNYRESWQRMINLLGKMHKAGVPIAAGTDGSGIEIVHELEIYQQAGFTPGEALAAATIVPARLVGKDKVTGSIRVGKIADLVLIEGDPSTRIGDLRQTRTVVLGGKLLDADALRKAAGFSGRPK